MSNPMTTARQALAAAIQTAIPTVSVYSAAPEVATVPAILLQAGTPWARPLTYSKTELSLIATVLAVQGTNEAATERLEETVWAAVAAIRATGAIVTTIGTPTQQTYGPAQYAATDVAVLLHVDD